MNLFGKSGYKFSPFLSGLAKPELDSVLAAASHRDLPGWTVFTEEGGPAREFFVLVSGRARYFFVSRTGRKVILHWIGPGEIVGGMSLLSEPESYMVSAETVKPTSMLVWKRDSIRHLLSLNPRLFDNALSFVLQYLLLYRIGHARLICDSARQRLASVLHDLAKCIGHPVENGIEVQVTNEDLASTANVTPFTTCRILSEWQRQGLVAKRRGRIILFSGTKLMSQARDQDVLGVAAGARR